MASKWLAALALCLAACGNDAATCTESDISSWSISEPAAPIYCDGKTVGYQLDLVASSGVHSFVLRYSAPLAVGGPVFVSADIDLLASDQGAVQRSASISRGSAVYADKMGTGVSVRADATVSAGADPVVYQLKLDLPIGTHYRGQIRNVKR